MVNKDITDKEFYLKHIEQLEDEIRSLKKENKNTYKMKVSIGTKEPCEVDTQLVIPREIGKYYYLPTDYKNPQKVYLVEYNNFQSVNNIIMILAAISVNGKIINTNPYLLFNNPDKAGDYYLQHKEELDFSFLYKEE